jgi:hypothetical protein
MQQFFFAFVADDAGKLISFTSRTSDVAEVCLVSHQFRLVFQHVSAAWSLPVWN